MKKSILVLAGICIGTFSFAQKAAVKPINAPKIKLENGQKIVATTNISIEADLSMGMQMTSTSSSEYNLEVKSSTDKEYTISSTLTKIKLDFNMAGQSSSYDSEKNPTPTSETDKAIAEKLNKPVDVLLDNSTGKATLKEKPSKTDEEDGNPMAGLMGAFTDASEDAIVAGAFELIPAGKKVGDSWSDTTKDNDGTTIRTCTLKSVNGDEAQLQINAVTTSSSKLDFQGMEFELKSTTKTNSEVTTEMSTGRIKTKNSTSDITGNIQVMGQDVAITSKATTTAVYK